MDVHDSHSSFIQTPKQLVVVILLAFLVPISVIILLVQLATSRPSADPSALSAEAVSKRLQPVGTVEFGAPQAAPGARTGEGIVKTVCAACHQAGVANAPKIGDAKDWAPRIKTGLKQLVSTALKGKGAMPARGGDASLTDAEVERAVVYLANQAGANFKEPAAPKEAAKPQPQARAPAAPAAAKPAAGANGKPVYDKVCMVCHAQGVAGAPKLGDKAAWAPRIQQGINTLVQSATKGKGAMPPKGGNASLSDAEIRAAVEFMVSQSK
ncbi:MAG: cytochrome c5 family protein [Betaproteobacteria bacterium]|nr:MAG: cytochrome c5 family protein [Betaproteobacteria bacterium]